MIRNLPYNTMLKKIFPVMFGFFIMGFIDIIGISSSYVKSDFTLNDSLANAISFSCFLWFLLVSIPTGMLMNKIGRKKTVLLSYVFTFMGMWMPWFSYSFTVVMVAFALIGIGNAMVQVALNPLVTNVVSREKLTGTLTIGQFVKAISSFLGPILSSWFAVLFFDWRYIFILYAVTTLLSGIWLWLVPIHENPADNTRVISFKETVSLLKDKRILYMFIGILVLVGVDVGINTTLPKYLMEKCGMELNEAVLGNSVYFFIRTVSAFLGGILLMKGPEYKFFKYSVWVSFAGLFLLTCSHSLMTILVCIVLFGMGYANLFSILFSLALKVIPEKANEISSLLIVGVSGGAVITPLLGVLSDVFDTQSVAVMFLGLIWLYMIWMIKKAQCI